MAYNRNTKILFCSKSIKVLFFTTAQIVSFSFIIFLLSQPTLYAKSSYCIENKLGWKFYCDDEPTQTLIKKEEIKDKAKDKAKDNNKEKDDGKIYTKQLSELQERLEETKAKAVLEPSEQNVKDYMQLQMLILNQASLFSDVWRRVLWVTPELDYTQQRPVSNIGKQVWSADRESREIDTLKNINKRYGIFFIYSSTCPYCQKYSQILYDLRQQYTVEIKGISVDGNFLPLWERNSFVNTGQLEQLNIDYSTVPVTVLYDNLSDSIILVGYGLMTQDDLMNRIYVLTQTKLGEDY
jgi:conjugal transfer pilus assembly protein TraF